MMGITGDDVAEPKISSSSSSASCRKTGPASIAVTAKQRAFLAEMGLNEAGMPLGRPSPPPPSTAAGAAVGTPPLAPPPRRCGDAAPPTGPSGSGPAERFKAMGNEAFEAGNFLQAIQHYTQAIDLAKASGADAAFMAALYSNRSASYLQGSKLLPSVESAYDHALCDAEEAIARRPNWFKGYSRQGDACFKAMRYREAVEAYEMALRLQPGNANLSNSLRESSERAKADSQEQWQTRLQTRKQHSLDGSGTLRRSSSSAVSLSLGEPMSPDSVGYDEGAAVSSLNATGCFGNAPRTTSSSSSSSPPSSTAAHGAHGRNVRELWSELKSEVETTAPEQVTGDDYRKQQLEKYRQQREAKERRLFGAGSSAGTSATSRTAAEADSSAVSSAVGSPKASGGGGGGGSPHGECKAMPSRRESQGSLTSGERVGSQVIPDEFSSTTAMMYQQRLLDQFRQRRVRA